MKSPRPVLFSFLLPALAFGVSGSDWRELFDGETLAGWKANESPGTWSVVGGAIVADGPVSHLFYVGPDGDATFGDFGCVGKRSYHDPAMRVPLLLRWPGCVLEGKIRRTRPAFSMSPALS